MFATLDQPSAARVAALVRAALVALLLVVGRATPVRGHASLVESEPAAGARLLDAPAQVQLRFSEAVDPALARVELRDASGSVVVAGPGTLDGAEARTLTMALPPLPDGTFSAVWRVRSAVDGHITEGVVGFSVGAGSPAASQLPPVGAAEPASALPAPADWAWRWLSYGAACLAVGPLLFGLAVWRPALRRAPAADGWATARLRRLALAGCIALAAATLGWLATQAALAGSDGGARLLAGRTGQLGAARLGLLAILGWLVWRLPPAGRGAAAPWWGAAALGGAVLLTFSLHSHAAALGSPLAVALDWLHLAAMAAWLGGLVALVALLRSAGERGVPPARLGSHFSRVALASVALLAATGVASSLLHVDGRAALLGTRYGQALLAKVGLFAGLVALGAANLLVLLPRLRRASGPGAVGLGRTARTEVLLGLGVLAAAALLASVAPAGEAWRAQQRLGWREAARQDGVTLVLRVAPLAVGDNEFAVDVTDPRPGANAVPATVLLRLRALDHDMGISEVGTDAQPGGRHTARGAFLTMAGRWEVEVILRRAGFDDVRHPFVVELAAGGEGRLEIGDWRLTARDVNLQSPISSV